MIQFKKIILHNFWAYAHAEIELTNKGFCLIKGENHFKIDAADSNGSGKSTWLNAISYVLSGETLKGLKSGFKNNKIEENLCYATLEFNYDNDSYVITRQANPHQEIRIIKNDLDISGKTFTDSKQILANHLPDITKDLLSAISIIGQGMPNALTKMKPSGRKELLENLTKTDFMINDVKERVSNTQISYNTRLRTCEDNLIVKKTLFQTTQTELVKATTTLSVLVKPNYDQEILEQSNIVSNMQNTLKESQSKLDDVESKLNDLTNQQINSINNKTNELNNMTTEYLQRKATLQNEDNKYLPEYLTLSNKITQISQIKDTCPTCGQKLVNVVKPDPTPLIEQLNVIKTKRQDISDKVNKLEEKHNLYTKQINDKYSNEVIALDTAITTLKSQKSLLNSTISNANTQITLSSNKIAELTASKNNFDDKLKELQEKENSLKTTLESLTKDITQLEQEKINLTDHLNVLKKMETLIKRDYRGLLLENVINYLDSIVKDFSEVVFGTRNMSIYLDGNDLEVSYDGKLVEALSGGEEAKVNLIVSLAIRHMLSAYLGIDSNILALDEVTDYLDARGCKGIMKLIEQELGSTESVFIISHRLSELNLPIDSEIKIIKDETGISSVYC